MKCAPFLFAVFVFLSTPVFAQHTQAEPDGDSWQGIVQDIRDLNRETRRIPRQEAGLLRAQVHEMLERALELDPPWHVELRMRLVLGMDEYEYDSPWPHGPEAKGIPFLEELVRVYADHPNHIDVLRAKRMLSNTYRGTDQSELRSVAEDLDWQILSVNTEDIIIGDPANGELQPENIASATEPIPWAYVRGKVGGSRGVVGMEPEDSESWKDKNRQLGIQILREQRTARRQEQIDDVRQRAVSALMNSSPGDKHISLIRILARVGDANPDDPGAVRLANHNLNGHGLIQAMNLLDALGYDTGAGQNRMGVMGGKAVADFQLDHPPLKVDGILGINTLRAMVMEYDRMKAAS